MSACNPPRFDIETCHNCGRQTLAGWCGYCHAPTQGKESERRVRLIEKLVVRLRAMADEQQLRQQAVYGVADIRDAVEREDVFSSAAAVIVLLHAELTASRAALVQAQHELRDGHLRLDETRAKETRGSIRERISWIIQLLTEERSEVQHMLQAAGHEKDELRAKAGAAEHRRAAAEYRAQRVVLDAELKARAKQAEADLLRAREALQAIIDARGIVALETALQQARVILPAPPGDGTVTRR